jgi:hypothetical protein
LFCLAGHTQSHEVEYVEETSLRVRKGKPSYLSVREAIFESRREQVDYVHDGAPWKK